MEPAIELFLSTENKTIVRIREILTQYFQPSEREDNWVLKEFFLTIFAYNPLQLTSQQHMNFWNTVGATIRQLYAENWETSAEYTISLNVSEKTISGTFFAMLVVILRTVVNQEFHNSLLSFYSFPENILNAFYRRAGLRSFLVNNILPKTDDIIRPISFFANQIHSPHTIRSEYHEKLRLHGLAQVTPEQQLYKEETSYTFPERTFPCGIRFETATPAIANFAITAYRYTWLQVRTVAASLLEEFRDHSVACRCARTLLSMDVCLPIVYALVTRSIDLKTLRRPSFHSLLCSPKIAPLLNILCKTADELRKYLQTGESALVDAIWHSVVGQRTVENTVSLRFSQLPEVSTLFGCRPLRPCTAWKGIHLTKMPVQLLLDALDLSYATIFWSTKLRKFFETESRQMFVAYCIPEAKSYSDLEFTIRCLKEEYGAHWPVLFNTIALVRLLDKSFIVARPEIMYALRLLSLLSATINSTNIATAMRSGIFLRAAVTQFQHNGELLAEISHFALAKFLAFQLGGLPMASNINNPTRKLYKWLPQILYYSENQNWSLLATALGHRASFTLSSDAVTSVLEHWSDCGVLKTNPIHKSLRQHCGKTPYRFRNDSQIENFLDMMFQNSSTFEDLYVAQTLDKLKAGCPYKIPDFVVPVLRRIDVSWQPSLEQEYQRIEILHQSLVQYDCFQQLQIKANYCQEISALFGIEQYTLEHVIPNTLNDVCYARLLRTCHSLEWTAIKRSIPAARDCFASIESLKLLRAGCQLALDAEGRVRFENTFHILSERPNDPRRSSVPLSSDDQVMLSDTTIETLFCQYNLPWIVPDSGGPTSQDYLDLLRKHHESF